MIYHDKNSIADDMAELTRRLGHLEIEVGSLRDSMFHFLKNQHNLRDDFDKHVNTPIYNCVYYPRTVTADDIKDIERRLYKMSCHRSPIWSEF